jgi:hypothetical protein
MEVKTITYQRVKNLGNYESESLEMTAEVELDDYQSVSNAVANLKGMVLEALDIEEEEKPVLSHE